MATASGTLTSRHTTALTTVDSPMVFIVRALLLPIIPVATLALCLACTAAPWHGCYVLLAFLAFVGASESMGLARVSPADWTQRPVSMLIEISARWLMLVTLIGLLVHLSGLAAVIDVPSLLAWAVVTPLFLYLGQTLARHWLTKSLQRHGALRRAVIVGMTDLGLTLERVLQGDVLLSTQIAGYFEDRAPERLRRTSDLPILGRTADLGEYVASHRIEQVFITLPMDRNPRILTLLAQLHNSAASIYFVPDLFAFNLIQARFDILSGIPIVAVRETPFYGASWLVKRMSDVLIASAALLLLLPVMLAVALCIRLESVGPVLFRQVRYGLDGREIRVYKFRSMSVTEDGKHQFTAAARADKRVTRVGAFIRKTSLDELPQLLNVVLGTMSIVGPRPHPVAMNEHYRREIPSYMVRHKVKPGITGWAQVNGYRGGDDLESMRKRIECDLAYVRHWSLWLDVRILLRTVSVVWSDRNAF
jgi:putative colanic acid biosynthesis UDP-glucose lipid carrier transferase